MTTATLTVEDFEVPARDGYALAATLFRPAGEARRAVLISSATAVPRGFYRRFATALAEAGYLAVTYDYRGIGDSKPRSLRGFPARMRDWGLLDMAGVIDWLYDSEPLERLFLVGHSVGGQVAGLLDKPELVHAMVTLSAQSGYWKLQGAEQKLTTAFHVHVTLPLFARTWGYVPWSWFGAAEDLPPGVAREWSGWCRNPGYLLGDPSLPLERYHRFTAPVLAYSIGDDKWGRPKAVEALMRAYPNVERRHVEPAAAGLDAIGHFGFFRADASGLWPDLIAWLDGSD